MRLASKEASKNKSKPARVAQEQLVAELVGRIKAAFLWRRSSIFAVVEAGQLLIALKAAAGHGNFIVLVEEKLPFSPSTAQRLMRIARDVRIAKLLPGLPPIWSKFHSQLSAHLEAFIQSFEL
jgi:hypothetical protein